jgi:hypothetical protein
MTSVKRKGTSDEKACWARQNGTGRMGCGWAGTRLKKMKEK